MHQGTIEQNMLAAIEHNDHLDQFVLHGIDHEDFTMREMSQCYLYILDYHSHYHELPTLSHLNQALNLSFAKPSEPFAYWLTEFTKVNAARNIELSINSVRDMIESDPDEAIDLLVERLNSIKRPKGLTIPPTDTGIIERLTRFENRMSLFLNSGGTHIMGVPTGIDAFDNTHMGWMPGEATGFFERPTVGKSWMLFREGTVAWINGYRVLCICPEMDAGSVGVRVDTLIAGHLGMHISNTMLREGNPGVYDSYKRLVSTVSEKVSEQARWWTVQNIDGRAVTISDIRTLARQFEPDVILVDGISLLKSESRTSASWEEIRDLSYGLRNLSLQVNSHVLVSHQAVNSRRGQRKETDDAAGRGDDWIMPSLNDAAFGDAFVQAMGNIFTMASDRDSDKIKWYSIRKARDRNIADGKRRAFAWDVDSGRIIDMGKHGSSMEAIFSDMNAMGIKP